MPQNATHITRLFLALSIFSLGGCIFATDTSDPANTGPTGGGNASPRVVYIPFDSADLPVDPVSGVTIAATGFDNDEQPTSFNGTGTYNQLTGALDFITDTVTFSDSNGPDDITDYVDGAQEVTLLNRQVATNSSYEFVGTFSFQDTATNFAGFGVLGSGTDNRDMPTGGRAIYSGGGTVFLNTGSEFFATGTAAHLVADFGQAAVDVTLSDFFGSTDRNGSRARLPFDEVRLNDMQISGSRFSGGSFQIRNAGTVVGSSADLDASASSEGAFFGIDRALGAPDEAGGGFTATYSDGGAPQVVLGNYIVD